MANILVSGGAGYIGSHTVHFLKKSGHAVTVVDDLSRGHEHNVAVQQVQFRKITLTDTPALVALMQESKFDAVIHFAAYIAVGESTVKPELYFTNNVAGSISLLTAMGEVGLKRIVFSSTAAVYGNPTESPIKETSPFSPINPYGETKVMVEKTLSWLDQYRDLRFIALRYFNACGAEPEAGLGEEHDPETHLIPLLLRAVITGKPITIFGDDYPTADGTCVRDYIHVSDLAQAHILAVEHLMNGGSSNQFNVGTGSGRSVREVLEAVEAVTGKKVPHIIGPRRSGDPAELVADSEKLKSTLKWKPKYTDIKDVVQTAWDFERNHTS